MKQFVKPFEYAEEICNALAKGVLLPTRQDNEVNTMTIGWGMLGIEWGKPVFLALVRQSRHTKKLLDATGEFTVNIPLEPIDKKIIGYCGSKSGREVDKIKELGLKLEDPEVISVPGIRQLPLTLECKVLYQQTQEAAKLPHAIVDRYYPEPYDDHTVYYGEIVSSYVIKE